MYNTQMNKRSIGMVIFLSIITCGIYYYVWLAMTTNELAIYLDDQETSGGMVAFLTIITCGIYGIYWWYKLGGRIAQAQMKAGMIANDNSTLYVILAIFGFGVIPMAIAQSDLNKLWDYASMQQPNQNQF